jgi:hypothetical protein
MFIKKAKLTTSILTAAFLVSSAACTTETNPGTGDDDDDDGGIPTENTSTADDDDDETTTPTGDDDDDDADDDDDETTTTDDDDDDTTTPSAACGDIDGKCFPIDLLFVIDNSGSMAEEQENLAKNFAFLVEQLNKLTDSKGNPIPVSLNVMVTSTDMDHPRCAQNRPDDVSDPLLGKPVEDACLERLPDFIFKESETSTLDRQQICKDYCEESDYVPKDGGVLSWTLANSNLQNTDGTFSTPEEAMEHLTQAFGCMGLQGIGGCGYEGTLEAMMQALNPDAPHNKGSRPFIRDAATLAIMIMTDEEDCSVLSDSNGGGYVHWDTDPEKNEDFKYWAKDADGKPVQSSAICWNGGVECTGDDGDGAYESCVSVDNGVLHPTSRYKDLLNKYWGHEGKKKNVLMLGILGVPEVTERDPVTNLPIAGGVLDLKYNMKWTDGDIPSNVSDTKEALDIGFGIGKGCSSEATGVAVPPVRVREVCESLNYEVGGQVMNRCCIESICDERYDEAIKCLAGLVQTLDPIE